jgi:hypothetical protein
METEHGLGCGLGCGHRGGYITVEVFIFVFWVVDTATSPFVLVGIPFGPEDLILFVDAPVHLMGRVIVEGACKPFFGCPGEGLEGLIDASLG